MATVPTGSNATIFKIEKWLGLNESPSGDTSIKTGESPSMRNFRVSPEGHLKIRPGYKSICTISEGDPIRGLWEGYIGGVHYLVAACGGSLYKVDVTDGTKVLIGEIGDYDVSFFGFSEKLYILTGEEYFSWNGTSLSLVSGYIPIVTTAAPPEGGGTLLESVNMLTGKKKAVFSPDGTATQFQLPEESIDAVLSVEGTTISYTSNVSSGKITFSSAPPKGISSITITWKKGEGTRSKVTSQRFSELYNGASDFRVFLYGDGTNRTIYSGLDEHGKATAEYFPELNVMDVDSANTPITSMIRHYDRMLVFKSDSSYSVSYSPVSLVGETVIAGFYVSTLNREIGNVAAGQTLLIQNVARTIFGDAVYDWGLAANSSRDERNAKRISDKVAHTLGAFDLPMVKTFDNEITQEFYILSAGTALIQNYENGTWYYYTDFPAVAMAMVSNELYFATADGQIMHLSSHYRNNNGAPIDAHWESGSMAFDAEWIRKYSSLIWVSIKPQSQARIQVTVQSNLKSDYPTKVVSAGLASFSYSNFARFSFGTNRKPQLSRLKLKVKKATFYKLIFFSQSTSATVTILSTNIQVRYTGNVK